MIAYDSCLSPSDLLHFVKSSLGPSTLLQMALFHSFLWLSTIPLYILSNLQYGLILSQFLIQSDLHRTYFQIRSSSEVDTNSGRRWGRWVDRTLFNPEWRLQAIILGPNKCRPVLSRQLGGEIRVQIPASVLIGCVTLGKLLKLSGYHVRMITAPTSTS